MVRGSNRASPSTVHGHSCDMIGWKRSGRPTSGEVLAVELSYTQYMGCAVVNGMLCSSTYALHIVQREASLAYNVWGLHCCGGITFMPCMSTSSLPLSYAMYADHSKIKVFRARLVGCLACMSCIEISMHIWGASCLPCGTIRVSNTYVCVF